LSNGPSESFGSLTNPHGAPVDAISSSAERARPQLITVAEERFPYRLLFLLQGSNTL
jgi:hypothetical protein